MEQVFTALSRAVDGAPPVALLAATAWGVLSIVLSPCHLASIPLIVGFISEQTPMSLRRAFETAACFAGGILVTIALIGLLTAAAGRMMGDLGPFANYGVALIFFLVGLHLMGVIPLPFSGPAQVKLKRKGRLAAFVLGVVFGLALGPCTFAYMAPMLAVTFKLAQSRPWYGTLLLLAYGVGHCGVIVAAGTCTEWVQRVLNWNEQSRSLAVLKAACGGLVILGGVWLIYTAP